jgi:hypothetical protein
MISAATRTTTGSGLTRLITTGSADSRTTTGLRVTFLAAGSVATDALPGPVLDTRVSATGESAGAVTVTAAICGSGSSRRGSSCTVATVSFRGASVVFVGAGTAVSFMGAGLSLGSRVFSDGLSETVSRSSSVDLASKPLA